MEVRYFGETTEMEEFSFALRNKIEMVFEKICISYMEGNQTDG